MRSTLLVYAPLFAQLAACGPPPPGPQVAEAEPAALRFPHERHSKVQCTECHNQESVLGGRLRRPGSDDHAPCDRAQCHRKAFLGPPGELCSICHEAVDITHAGQSPLVPYPPAIDQPQMPSSFSHTLHLDFAAMEETLGFHVSCTDCHTLNDNLSLNRPGHSACTRCHAPESTPKDAPSLKQCQGCHRQQALSPAPRRLIRGDVHFAHERHRADRRGKLIPCSTCHATTREANQRGKHKAPQMRSCVDCHDDTNRVPRTKRMRICETCHATRTAGLGSLAPRSHLPATERPADHTGAFRRDHADDARADAPRCARCHTSLSGSARDTCDECHQVMRPSDHVVTWREFDHGPEAATRNDRCQTCHQVDFCVACHSQRPRSHFPIGAFTNGGHGTQAVMNPRACLTCHRIDNCTPCHRGTF
jgi:hypothetical protein